MTSLLALLAVAPVPVPISGWVPLWSPDAPKTYIARASQIREAMVDWVVLDDIGIPKRTDLAKRETLDPIHAAAKANKGTLYLMATNYGSNGFDPVRMSKMLASSIKRDAHIAKLVSIAQEDGFQGIDLDYESLSAKDRDEFSDFVDRLKTACRRANLILSVTVHPKTKEPGDWEGPQAQDWEKIGASADVVRIMCYDEHWDGSDPGPIASNAWVDSVIRYAVDVIPPTKIELGVAAYGYDWNTKPARSLAWSDVPKPFDFEIDPASGERFKGKIFFAGPESLAMKQEIARKYGLRGLSMWYIGSEAPGWWEQAAK